MPKKGNKEKTDQPKSENESEKGAEKESKQQSNTTKALRFLIKFTGSAAAGAVVLGPIGMLVGPLIYGFGSTVNDKLKITDKLSNVVKGVDKKLGISDVFNSLASKANNEIGNLVGEDRFENFKKGFSSVIKKIKDTLTFTTDRENTNTWKDRLSNIGNRIAQMGLGGLIIGALGIAALAAAGVASGGALLAVPLALGVALAATGGTMQGIKECGSSFYQWATNGQNKENPSPEEATKHTAEETKKPEGPAQEAKHTSTAQETSTHTPKPPEATPPRQDKEEARTR